jgi:hypothetical protein
LPPGQVAELHQARMAGTHELRQDVGGELVHG